ncbi:hypothetical protein GRI40_05405 [Altererythrobacter aerius]|uniref:Uncharacterized protein n=1 Tax=Tsuneonella aeria TaxID=1837929 RepID=A0A6I4TAX6_9SPHN|nr:hypothetical protein [Tsuneonella aeria]MXO74659.1 hypothetical protein [Tsuneonella aeria]
MSMASTRRRGEPLVALVLLVVGWAGVRAYTWDTPFPDRTAPATFRLAASREGSVIAPAAGVPDAVRSGDHVRAPRARVKDLLHPAASIAFPGRPARATVPHRPAPLQSVTMAPPVSYATTMSSEPQRTAPPLLHAAPGAPHLLIQRPVQGASPWRLDAWAAWRPGSGLVRIADGARPASYGGSQAGASIRRILAAGPHQPSVHLRATYAPDRPRQADLAAGLGVRPIAGLPVRVIAEARATRVGADTELRPAAFAVTEVPPMDLPLGLTAEGYAQAGWVDGRHDTAFVDGQARVTRTVGMVGPVRLDAGAGAWGGAQKFAERLDIGPTLSLAAAEGPAAVRLSLDYRVRVAGRASPGNGPAITLSTGF